MKKDKEWLKEAIKNSELVSSAKLYDLIDQLDEPAVSNETVNDILASNRKLSKRIKELENQLEEPEQKKVVIPQFVADFITEIKPNFNIRTVFTLKNNKHEQGQEWALDNPDVFARAWLDGYTVEKEQLYYLKLPNNGYFGELTDEDYFERTIRKERAKKFTEQEIKAIDERYLAFKVEVTE